jgi:competence protein ComEA
LPATLQGRVQLGATHLTLVAVAVALALGLTAWWSVRAQDPGELAPAGGALSADVEEPLVEQAPGASGAGQPPGVAGEPGGATPEAVAGAVAMPQPGAPTEVVVDVAGRVRRPGIVRLPVGARVVDALEAAGGARPRVDLRSVNLARLLVDGEQVLVGVPPPAGVAASAAVPGAPDPAAGTTGGTAAPPPLVNINTADLALLDTLPGVGPVTAEAIIGWRTDNGGFTAVDDLLDVSGIGEATLAELAPLVTV